MTISKALAYIEGSKKFGIKPGLAREIRLLALLGNPQDQLSVIHVAGTNAKGSICSMIHACLTKGGYQTGLYTSPYIERFNERIKIGENEITDAEIARYVEILLPHIKTVSDEGLGEPTEFEIITALAFCYFADRGCDFVVLEVGLGGRLDATNVLKSPILTVIASVSKDHTRILGDSISKIAYEKCGIIKEGRPVVVYPIQEADAMEEILKTARLRHAKPVIPDIEQITDISCQILGNTFAYRDCSFQTGLAGRHQIYNAVTAIEALLALREEGVILTDEQIKEGIACSRFIGRLETIRKKPYVLMDGAHNPSGIDALLSAVDEFLSGRRIVTVMGMMKDKEYPYAISKIAEKSDVFIAVTPKNDRALAAAECARLAKQSCACVMAFDEVKEGIDCALGQCGKEDVLLVCGSLYLIGEARPYIRQK